MPTIPKKRDLDSERVRVSLAPVWKGPEVEGVSQSMLAYYLVCKERFRVYTVDGLTVDEGFNVPIEFGNMWHECEEALSAGNSWVERLTSYTAETAQKNRRHQQQIVKHYNIIKVLFPIYVEFWSKHGDMVKKIPLLQEENFNVPYKLPSGRVVKLRGKWDAVDYLEGDGIFLQENKTKSTIDTTSIEKQLTNDLQVMTYLIALREYQLYSPCDAAFDAWNKPIKGVRYNVIRRPLGGGKGSIRPRKGTKNVAPETMADFYRRLEEVIQSDVESYFKRWKVYVSEKDLRSFEEQTLVPVLENLCDDYDWWAYAKANRFNPFDVQLRGIHKEKHNSKHFRLPYGVYNIIHQGGFDDLDNYLNTGSTIGLCNVPTYFPELE